MNFQLQKKYILAFLLLFSGCFAPSAMAQNLGERERIVILKDKTAEDSSVKNEKVKDETAKESSIEDKTVKNEKVKDSSVKDETAKDETIKDEKVKDETKKKKTEIQLSFFNESLTNGYGNWRTASLDFKRAFDTRSIVYGFFQVSRRNEFHDREVMLGFYQPINRKWSFTVEGTFSPTHKFVGKYSGMAKIEKIFSKGWVGSIGVRRNQYNIVNATSGLVSVEKYWKSYRAAYSLNITNLQNSGTSTGNRFSFNKYYGEDNNTVGVNFGFGRELENIGTRVLQSNTMSASIGVRQWLSPHWGITADASIHRQDKYYYRSGLYGGLRLRF